MEYLTPTKIAALTSIYVFLGFLCGVLIGDRTTGWLSYLNLGKRAEGWILLSMPIFWPVIMFALFFGMMFGSYMKEITDKFS